MRGDGRREAPRRHASNALAIVVVEKPQAGRASPEERL